MQDKIKCQFKLQHHDTSVFFNNRKNSRCSNNQIDLSSANMSLSSLHRAAREVCQSGHRAPEGSAAVWTTGHRENPLRTCRGQQNGRVLHQGDRLRAGAEVCGRGESTRGEDTPRGGLKLSKTLTWWEPSWLCAGSPDGAWALRDGQDQEGLSDLLWWNWCYWR